MYAYSEFDEDFVRARVRQFRDQVERRIDGRLTEDEFRPLRLMNGLYLQLHAYMLRVAIPYGTLNALQMRQLAMIAERWDRGYGHFTTRQNIQFNWPRLRLVRRGDETGFEVSVGGGLGRTPMLGQVIRDFLPEADLLPYLEAILGVYNRLDRRDNKYKARIKIAVHEIGLETLRDEVEVRFAETRAEFGGADRALLAGIAGHFAPPAPPDGPETIPPGSPAFHAWCDTNLAAHRRADHAIVTVSLKTPGQAPGDASAWQMRLLADLAERYGHDKIRISHRQNVVLPHMRKADLPTVFAALADAGLAATNAGHLSDIIACPGLDYCALASARSIPVAQQVAQHFEALKIEHEVGPLRLNISGCINACAHHHVAEIGILGLERAGSRLTRSRRVAIRPRMPP